MVRYAMNICNNQANACMEFMEIKNGDEDGDDKTDDIEKKLRDLLI